MFYYLYEFFDVRFFHYISVRAGFSFFISFLLTIFLMPKYIAWAKAKKANQPINKYVPAHENKQDTPTMGGAVFIFSTVVASLLTVKFTNLYAIGGLFTLIGFALIGLKDDLGKILNKNNLEGLTARKKLILLMSVALLVAVMLIFLVDFPTTFYLPFIKTAIFDMGFFAIFFWILVIISTSNAVNLTDGLDGLATVPTVISLGTLGAIIYLTGHAEFAKYLFLPNISGVGEVTIVASALAGWTAWIFMV